MSALSPVAPGTPLRFAVETDSSVPLEFKFIRYQVSIGQWTVIQDYSFRPVWSWTPTVGDLDDYYLQVWIRARGSTNAYDEWRSLGPFTISVSLASIVSLTSDTTTTPEAGTTITWTAAAHGGSLRLEYQFVRYSAARARWEIVRDWSPDPVWVQTTTPADQGENTVIVVVKSSGGECAEALQEARVLIAPPETSYVLVTRPSSGNLPGGQQIFFSDREGGYLEATASSGLNITATRVLPDSLVSAAMKNPGGGVPVVGTYENAEWRYPDAVAGVPALEVNTTLAACTTPLAGRFRILELEYDAGGTVSRVAADVEAFCDDKGSAIFVAARLNSTLPLFNMFSFTSNAPSTVGAGTPVMWTADASSGTGRVEYRFIRYSAQQGAWTIVRDWSLDPQFAWTPSTGDYGSYSLQVWARTAGSEVAYEDWRSSDLFAVVPSEVTVYGLHWDAARARAGQAVTLEAVAGGGSGALEYRFVQFEYATGRWSVIREYAPSNRAEWTPTPGSGGEYAVQVWVREAGSMAAYDAWTGAPFTLAPARLLLISGRPGDPISGGRSVNLALSGANPWTYWMSANAIDDEGSWYALFDIGREPWATGVFDGADTSNGPPPSLSVQHAGSSCQSSGGRFTVNELEVLPNGLPDRISIDFEQLCDGATAPLYGGLRYNSNIPLVYALSVMPSTTSATVGSPVTFTGVGSSATDAVEYRFFVLRQESGQWSLVREVRRRQYGHMDSAVSGQLHHPALGAPPRERGELRILCQRPAADGPVTNLGEENATAERCCPNGRRRRDRRRGRGSDDVARDANSARLWHSPRFPRAVAQHQRPANAARNSPRVATCTTSRCPSRTRARQRERIRALILVTAMALTATAASADTITFSFGGVTDAVDPLLAGDVLAWRSKVTGFLTALDPTEVRSRGPPSFWSQHLRCWDCIGGDAGTFLCDVSMAREVASWRLPCLSSCGAGEEGPGGDC